MRSLLKFIGFLAGFIIFLAILAIVILITFVDPNRFKPLIAEQINKTTGRQLQMTGPLSWTFFPYLGVKAEDVELGNSAAFVEKNFVNIKKVTLSVKLLPLLHGQIQSSGLVLTGLKLNLIKNSAGIVNWDFANKAVPVSKDLTKDKLSSVNQPTTIINAGKKSFSVMLAGIDLSDAQIAYTDQQTKQVYHFDHVELHIKNVNFLQAFPVTGEFDFNLSSPAIRGKASLDTKMAINLEKQIVSLRDLVIKGSNKDNDKAYLELTGNVLFDMKEQTAQWTDFIAKIANIDASGEFDITHLNTKPQLAGHLQIKPFDLPETLKQLGIAARAMPVAKQVQGVFDITGELQSIDVKGSLHVNELQLNNIKLQQVETKIAYHNHVLTFDPINAKLYSGNLIGSSVIDLNNIQPKLHVIMKLAGIQAAPLIKDLAGPDQKLTIDGAGNVQLDVTTVGLSADRLVSQLNGRISIGFSNGYIDGVDVGYLIDNAYAAIKRQQNTIINSGKTEFGNLSATANIQNGIVTNNDLSLNSPRFNTTGKGTINLPQKQIDYDLLISPKQMSDQKDDLRDLYGVQIPLHIYGNLNSPAIRLNTDQLLKTLGQQQVKKSLQKVEEKLQEKFKDKLPGKAGDLLKNFLGN
jgi:AsmA protein